MSLAEALISLIAPPYCVNCNDEGSALCLACQTTEIIPYGERCFGCGTLSPAAATCAKCRRRGAPKHVWVATDYEGAAQKLITRYKFSHLRSASKVIASLMRETLLTYSSDSTISGKQYVVTYIPTATSRVRERGFDHADLLASELARSLGLPRASLLIRLGQDQQVGARRTERLRQAKASYKIKNNARVSGRNILLIDDVVTTGATLSAVASELRRAGAGSVDALVFAKKL